MLSTFGVTHLSFLPLEFFSSIHYRYSATAAAVAAADQSGFIRRITGEKKKIKYASQSILFFIIKQLLLFPCIVFPSSNQEACRVKRDNKKIVFTELWRSPVHI